MIQELLLSLAIISIEHEIAKKINYDDVKNNSHNNNNKD